MPPPLPASYVCDHQGFWYPPLGGAGDPVWDSTPNPYEGAPVNAPFDQKFYLVGTTTMAIHPWAASLPVP